MVVKTLSLRSLLSLLSLLSLCGATEDIQFITVKIGKEKTLDCGTEGVTWTFGKNETDEMEVEQSVPHGSHLRLEGGKLVLADIQDQQLGFYRCSQDGVLLNTFQLDISFKLRRLPKSVSVDEGSPVQLDCVLNTAGQEVEFRWFSLPEDEEDDTTARQSLCDQDCSSSGSAQPEALLDQRSLPVPAFADRAEIIQQINEDGIPISTLKISKTFKEDRKIYICQATLKNVEEDIENCAESKECDETQTVVRVKDPLAAVWPFIGIVAEVVLLCIIIFFCEKSKSEDKEEYDEGANGSNNVSSSNSNIRQRK